MAAPKTLFEKIWDSHLVDVQDDGTCLLYIDRHLTHEVTTPQPYEGLRQAGRHVRRTDATIAVLDHNIPTDWSQEIPEDSQLQIDTLRQNCSEFGVELYEVDDARNGIVHVIGPEQGLPCPALLLFVVIVIRRPTGRLVLWRLASAHRKWSMSWRHRRSFKRRLNPCASRLMALCRLAVLRKISSLL